MDQKKHNENPEELFDIIQQLGNGHFAQTYKALDKSDGELVALKIVRIDNDLELIGLKEKMEAMTKLKSDHIINCKGVWRKEDDSRVEDKDEDLWIAMEYCIGGATLDIMRALKISLTEEQIAVVMRETLKALQYAHEQKVIHRDVKAANIFINTKGQCKLSDLGVKQILDVVHNREWHQRAEAENVYWWPPGILKYTAEYLILWCKFIIIYIYRVCQR